MQKKDYGPESDTPNEEDTRRAEGGIGLPFLIFTTLIFVYLIHRGIERGWFNGWVG